MNFRLTKLILNKHIGVDLYHYGTLYKLQYGTLPHKKTHYKHYNPLNLKNITEKTLLSDMKIFNKKDITNSFNVLRENSSQDLK